MSATSVARRRGLWLEVGQRAHVTSPGLTTSVARGRSLGLELGQGAHVNPLRSQHEITTDIVHAKQVYLSRNVLVPFFVVSPKRSIIYILLILIST